MKIRYLLPFLVLLLCSCSEYTPKPKGYPYIEKINIETHLHHNSWASFQLSDASTLTVIPSTQESEQWFNISYWHYDATIHCTYLRGDGNKIRQAFDDSYHLAYSHSTKADGIRQTLYNNPKNKVSGILYDIEGSVATPIQFFVTDSVTNFLRGSVYFNQKVDTDSVAPIISYLREDVVMLIETLEWKNK